MKSLSTIVLVVLTVTLTESFKTSSSWLRKSNLAIAPIPRTQAPPTTSALPSLKKTFNVWDSLTFSVKERVKAYFIKRATDGGIPWKQYYDLGATNMETLLQNCIDITTPSIVYPAYYTQAFHSYEEGNLNWEAALEVVAATISISANYWPLADVVSAELWMRGNTTNAIKEHIANYEKTLPNYVSSKARNTGKIMDIGCSVGASTKFLIEAFPEKSVVDAVDLSPYFLAAAKFYHRSTASPMFTALSNKIKYHHMMAEDLSFPSNSYDIVSISYLLHEIPTKTSEEVIAEAFRVLRPGGTLSIVDLNGKRIKALPQPRKHFFELTEPLILQYYKTDPMKILADAGFTAMETKGNDPMNVLWIATKPLIPPVNIL